MIASAIAERDSRAGAPPLSEAGTTSSAPSETPPADAPSEKPRLVGKRSRS